jgi:hypothetical protein
MANLFRNTIGPTSLNPTEAAPPPTHVPTYDDSDARSDSSMPDLLSDEWSDSDSSQDARDVEMNIVPDDDDDSWVDEDEVMLPPPSTVPVDPAPATDRRARVEEEVEPQPPQPNHVPNPAPPPRLPTGFPTLPPWNFGLGTTRPPGRLFPLFQNPSTPFVHRDDTTTNPRPQPTQPPPPDPNPAPGNAQQDTQGPRFHAHTFILGMDGTGRPVPLPPGAFSAMFSQLGFPMPQPQTQTAQPGQPPDQPGETRDQPGDPGQLPPFFDFVAGGLGPLPPLFADPFVPGPQPPADGPRNEGGPEPGRGAPAWAELLRAMLGGEPPEEREDPERAKTLVKGLERVPVGLVKRVMRVGGVPGAHEDSTGTYSGESPGCAICWDSLLPEDPSVDTTPCSDSTTSPVSEHPTEGSNSKSAASDPTPDDDASTAIVCLPCAHVFHASCLIPWFSKPKHTTCPTCRFDVDPKNLTYIPPPMRPRPAPATATDATPPNNTQPQPIPASAPANPPPAPPSTTDQAQGHEHPPPLDPVSDDEDDNEYDDDSVGLVTPPVFIPDLFAAQPQRTLFDMFRGPAIPQAQDHGNGNREQHQGPDWLPEETRNGVPDSPPMAALRPPQQPPVFGPPPPPEHPTHGTRATTADAAHDHGHGPHPEHFFGGVGHAHFQAPGIAVDFTLHVPPEHGIDPERLNQAVQDQAAAFLQFFTGGGRGPGTGQPAGPAPGAGGENHEPEGPREWMPPPAPGPTLRQRVEARERQAGLRCDDPSCGVGPSDEDPFPDIFNDPNSPSVKRVEILRDCGEEAVCEHVFHPACLVSAGRCAGWREDRSANDVEEYEVASCPVCRSVGKVQRQVWEAGAKSLLV